MAKKESETEQENSTGLPFLNAYGNITKALEKIITAQTPPRFTHDFLQTKLNLTGGSARPIIPFLKRTGFIRSDGTPTELYNKFRNKTSRGEAAANAVRKGYASLYEVNEYVHDAKDSDLKGLIVQVTGLSSDSSAVKGILGSFKALKSFAKFDGNGVDDVQTEDEVPEESGAKNDSSGKKLKSVDLKLGYTINLNLPATSDIAVFDAIFKSLRNNLLDE